LTTGFSREYPGLQELHNLYFSPIIMIVKSKALRCGEMRNVYKTAVGTPKGNRQLRRLRMDDDIDLKVGLKVWTGFIIMNLLVP
jgi:hypothetical protein